MELLLILSLAAVSFYLGNRYGRSSALSPKEFKDDPVELSKAYNEITYQFLRSAEKQKMNDTKTMYTVLTAQIVGTISTLVATEMSHKLSLKNWFQEAVSFYFSKARRNVNLWFPEDGLALNQDTTNLTAKDPSSSDSGGSTSH